MYAGYISFSVQNSWANKNKLDGTTHLSPKFCYFQAGFKKQIECEGKIPWKDVRDSYKAQMIIGHQENRKHHIAFFEGWQSSNSGPS